MKFINVNYFVFIAIGVIGLSTTNYAKGGNATRDSLKAILSQEMELDYLKQAAILAGEREDEKLMVYNNINIGYIYLDLKEYEKSLTYIKPNIADCEELNDTLSLSIMKNILGQVYLGLEDYDTALEFSEEAVVLAESN